jgi:hypothetical protein
LASPPLLLLLLLLLLLRTSCCTKCALCTTLLGSDATLRPMCSICKADVTTQQQFKIAIYCPHMQS